MCTSIVTNFKRTIVGFNLDYKDADVRVSVGSGIVSIDVFDQKEGWMPLFGGNTRGDFVAMPTCWPFDKRSNSKSNDDINIINLDIDLLLMKNTFDKTKQIVETQNICSVDFLTFMAQLSNKNGDVLKIVPGVEYEFIKRPKYSVMTNFSPFDSETKSHPWMGKDRYDKAVELLEKCDESFSAKDCLNILKEVAQDECPTRVSMVYDVDDKKIYWVNDRDYSKVESISL